MILKFQVAAVKKPLIVVKRIVEKGNWVSFGPGERDNYIRNGKTSDRVFLKEDGKGSYLLDVNFLGGERTIAVD
eukprot:2363162-Karenia_brevis.AAC.1